MNNQLLLEITLDMEQRPHLFYSRKINRIPNYPTLLPYTAFARFALNIAIYYTIFKSPDLMELICGPFTLAPAQKISLFYYILFEEVIRVFFPFLVRGIQYVLKHSKGQISSSPFKGIVSLMITKYSIIFIFKIVLFFYEKQRFIFYVHSLFIELVILFIAGLSDLFKKNNISQAIEVIFLDSLFRLSVVYQVTRTFSPNLILYYFITNLFVLCLMQIQTQARDGFISCLYVKHDVYRILVVALVYFGLFSFMQLSSYGLKMLVLFLAVLQPYYRCIQKEKENAFQDAKKMLFLVCILFAGLQMSLSAMEKFGSNHFLWIVS